MSMFADTHNVRTRLYQMAKELVCSARWDDDLVQEALIHFWKLEKERPGQSRHWYLRGCRFHLQNYLRRGRSIDSQKHVRAPSRSPAGDEDGTDPLSSVPAPGDFRQEIIAKDVITVVSRWLQPPERDTLACFAEGLSARETAARLHVSHTLINRHRLKIAKLVERWC